MSELMESASRHQCLLYAGSPSCHLPALTQVVRRKLGENYRCLYLNSPAMVAGMQSCLAASGVDVSLELKMGSLVLSTEQSHIDHGVFDPDRMLEGLEQSVQQALDDGHAGLFAAGDMTWELGPDKNIPRLLQYEWKLEQLFRKYPGLSGVCMYHSDTLPGELVKHGAAMHGKLFVNETLSVMNPYYVHTGAPRESVPTLASEVEAFLVRMMPEPAG